MDLNDYWQENKRFVTTVAVGVVAFLVARQVLAGQLESGIQAASRSIATSQRERNAVRFDATDLAEVQAENAALRASVEALAGRLRFEPRPEFALDAGAGSASNQYLRTLSRVREELLVLAGRAGLQLDESLGMPKLSPTRDEEIERHLEALDAIDQVVRLALDAGVDRIERITLRLDPGLGSRQGLGRIERTRVELELRGAPRAVLAVVAGTQRALPGRVLPIDTLEVTPSRAKDEEVRVDLTLVLPRLAEDLAADVTADEAS